MLRGFRHTLFLLLQVGVLVSGALAVAIWPASWPAIALCVAGSVAASLICERYASHYLRRTLGQLRRAADEIGRGNPQQPLAAQPGDDYYKLVVAINQTASRIAQLSQDQQRLQEELRRSERLAFLGELAASVAHEVNNPLDGVQNCVRILRKARDNPERAQQMLDLIDSGLDRIEMIVRRLLTLARSDTIRPAALDLHATVDGALEHVSDRVAECGITVRRDFQDEARDAHGDQLLLEQVFLNLFRNACDAMPEGGELVARILAEPLPNPHGDSGEETWLRIDVADSGPGIPDPVRAHIFEPFFTTKREGKGTGLGLPIAARIVQAHGGTLSLADRGEGGTVFIVRLPRPRVVLSAARSEPLVATSSPRSATPPSS